VIEAAIFDMDGLLINSEPFWHAAHISVLKHYGHTLTTDEVRAMAGRRTSDIAQIWKDRFKLDSLSAEELARQVVKMVITLIQEQGQALPGVEQTLRLFAKHDVPMAIASSSTPEVIDTVMKRFELSSHFQFAYSAINEARCRSRACQPS
jgi:mannitol-1-/sugar-/sorbitol-6-/2-deoxyglucose-6-phosphatase